MNSPWPSSTIRVKRLGGGEHLFRVDRIAAVSAKPPGSTVRLPDGTDLFPNGYCIVTMTSGVSFSIAIEEYERLVEAVEAIMRPLVYPVPKTEPA